MDVKLEGYRLGQKGNTAGFREYLMEKLPIEEWNKLLPDQQEIIFREFEKENWIKALRFGNTDRG